MKRWFIAVLLMLLPTAGFGASGSDLLAGAPPSIGNVAASLTAQNTFSDPFVVKDGFNFSLSGTWSATVHLQRSFDAGSTWLDVQNYTANIQDRGFEPEGGMLYRFGVKTGNFTSGTVVGRISR